MVCCFSLVVGSAQTNKYWQANESWVVVSIAIMMFPPYYPDAMTFSHYYVSGDSVVGTETYKKLFCLYKTSGLHIYPSDPLMGSTTIPVALLKERNDTVTIVTPQDTSWVYYSDTSVTARYRNGVGWMDTYQECSVVDSFLVNGVWRRKFEGIQLPYVTYEGALDPSTYIGINYGFTNVVWEFHEVFLVCYSGNDSNYVHPASWDISLYMSSFIDTPAAGGCNLDEAYWSALDEEELTPVSIYPNPAGETIVLTLSEPGDYDYMLYNALGIAVANGHFSGQGHTLNISGYPSGNYFLRLVRNSRSGVCRFVKE